MSHSHDHANHGAQPAVAPSASDSVHDHSNHNHDHHQADSALPGDQSTIAPISSDHSAHQMAGMDHGMMKMYFHGGFTETVLFEFWQINSLGGLIGSCIGLFILALLYEGLKVFREYLVERSVCRDFGLRHRAEGQHGDVDGNRTPLNYAIGTNNADGVEQVEVRSDYRPNPMSLPHLLQSFLQVVQVTISYILMLVVMTFNIWLTLAVVLGAGVGYFLFGWRKRVVIDINEHCH